MARFERRSFRGGFRGRFGSDIPKPVKVGEEYDVDINEVGSKGDGIARVNNFVVFVNGAKKGEKAHIKITEVRNRFAIGEKTTGSSEVEIEKKAEKASNIEEEAPTEELAEETTEEEK